LLKIQLVAFFLKAIIRNDSGFFYAGLNLFFLN